ncbi:hypothetical protein EH223_09105 [candidate division KSB1 bacterium]|nr:hypothetical protein [candidate division KSB1 bacterium]RQW03762.1 MAG: hypothetical protein EH223_09105 [candidate division KSB1 bacterium]
MAVDVLIIRNNCDEATKWTNWIGEGLATYLQGKGFSVTDLSGSDTSPENVTYWLSMSAKRTKKFVIALDHGNCSAFYGQKNGQPEAVINSSNAEDLTQDVHVYTFACLTNKDNCIGQKAIESGCLSWLGYTEEIYVLLAAYQPLKDCVWSYVEALVSGKTLEQAEQVLRQAYKDRISLHWIFQYNLDRLLLRKSANNMTIFNNNRFSGWRHNKKVLALYSAALSEGNGYIYVSDVGWRRLEAKYPDNVNTLMTMAAHAKSDNCNVHIYENEAVIQTLYVW